LRRALVGHSVATAYEMAWSQLDNGALLKAADAQFDLLVTTDQNLRHQHNLAGYRLAILILPITSWPKIRANQEKVVTAVEASKPGDVMEMSF